LNRVEFAGFQGRSFQQTGVEEDSKVHEELSKKTKRELVANGKKQISRQTIRH